MFLSVFYYVINVILAVPLRIKSMCNNRTETLKNVKVKAIIIKQASENSFRHGKVSQSSNRSNYRRQIGPILILETLLL